METIYETYTRTLCSNCKNKNICKEELRIRLDNTIKCDSYIKDKQKQGYKQFQERTAKQKKPIMRL